MLSFLFSTDVFSLQPVCTGHTFLLLCPAPVRQTCRFELCQTPSGQICPFQESPFTILCSGTKCSKSSVYQVGLPLPTVVCFLCGPTPGSTVAGCVWLKGVDSGDRKFGFKTSLATSYLGLGRSDLFLGLSFFICKMVMIVESTQGLHEN